MCDMRGPPKVKDRISNKILPVEFEGYIVYKSKQAGVANLLNATGETYAVDLTFIDDVIIPGIYADAMVTGCGYNFFDGNVWHDCYPYRNEDRLYDFVFDNKCSITGEGVKIWQI